VIVACGKPFHTGTRVILWKEPDGYDAYSLDPRFAPAASQPAEKRKPRYGSRTSRLSDEKAERVRRDGWDLPLLQEVVDQFVIHYDVCGTSQFCFQVLQDDRGLSVHFMLDLDGTIYQTLDLQEAAWHATKANGRSVGIEIAHVGAYPPDRPGRAATWYQREPDGQVRIVIPEPFAERSPRLKDKILRPLEPEPIVGTIQGERLSQYDFTPQQYESLIKLTATLCRAFPKLRCDYPKDADGKLVRKALGDEEWKAYQGVLGHYHVQTNKTDPGPAFQWDKVIGGARERLRVEH
jgi:N-acetyl-anhydromuramyl-L-alanine amidase AmpD